LATSCSFLVDFAFSSLIKYLVEVNFSSVFVHAPDFTSECKIRVLLSVIAFSGQASWHAPQYMQNSSVMVGFPFSLSLIALLGQMSTHTSQFFGHRFVFSWMKPCMGFVT